jgi:hypothetical protein
MSDQADQPLPSWKEGKARRTIVDFVTAATTPGPGFVELADRIATFDNAGTLWVEQPLPPRFDFVFGTWAQCCPSAGCRQTRMVSDADLVQDRPASNQHAFVAHRSQHNGPTRSRSAKLSATQVSVSQPHLIQ